MLAMLMNIEERGDQADVTFTLSNAAASKILSHEPEFSTSKKTTRIPESDPHSLQTPNSIRHSAGE